MVHVMFYFQTLAMLYKKKQHLLNSHILHLTFSLIGTVDSGKESSVIPNKKAFEDLLCDLEVTKIFFFIYLAQPPEDIFVGGGEGVLQSPRFCYGIPWVKLGYSILSGSCNEIVGFVF